MHGEQYTQIRSAFLFRREKGASLWIIAAPFCMAVCAASVCLPGAIPLSAEELGLAEAEQLAQRNSTDLRALRMEEEAARLEERSRFRDFFPSLSASYRRNRTVAQRDYDTGNNSLQLSISQPIYDGGRSIVAHQVAQIDSMLSSEKTEETANQLRLQIRQAYFEILQAEQNVRIVEASVRSYELLERTGQIEKKNGNISLLEFLQIKNQLAQRLQDLQTQKDQFATKLAAFRLQLRLSPGSEISLRPIDLRQVGTEAFRFDVDALIRQAIEKRPDIRRARMDLLKSRRQYDISEYHFLPTISLTGNYGKTGNDWPPNRAEWGVGVNVTFNLFGNTINSDYRYLNSASDTSKGYSTGGSANLFDKPAWNEPHLRDAISLLQSKDKRDALEQSIANDIRAMRAEYERRRRGLEVLDEATALQERKQRITEFQYRHGEVSFDEYLKQEAKLYESRFSLVGERIAYVLFIHQMEIALGLPVGGLGNLPIKELPRDNEAAIDEIWRPRTMVPENEDAPQTPTPEEKR